MVEVKAENIVASTIFAEKLDLDVIAKSLEEAEYEPEQFPGLVYRLKNPKYVYNLFIRYQNSLFDDKIVDSSMKWLVFVTADGKTPDKISSSKKLADNIYNTVFEICQHPYHV